MTERSASLVHRQQCPICGPTPQKEILSIPYSDPRFVQFFTQYYGVWYSEGMLGDERFTLMRCTSCGLVYQLGVPSDQFAKTIYDEGMPEAAKDEKMAESTIGDYSYLAWQVQWLVRNARKKPSDIRVLDFGLGWAQWAKMAQAYGCQVFGVELSKNKVAHAEANGIKIVPADALEPNSYDYINTEQVFEHLSEPKDMLLTLREAVRPNGLIKVSVPDGRNVDQVVSRMKNADVFDPDAIMSIHPLQHLNCFDHRSLDALGRSAQLQPKFPNILLMYDVSCGWFNLKTAAKNLLRPIYRHVYPKSTFAYFTKN